VLKAQNVIQLLRQLAQSVTDSWTSHQTRLHKERYAGLTPLSQLQELRDVWGYVPEDSMSDRKARETGYQLVDIIPHVTSDDAHLHAYHR
jgi:hypothetical protein